MFPIAEAIHVLCSLKQRSIMGQKTPFLTEASQALHSVGHDSETASLLSVFLTSALLNASRISAHALTTLRATKRLKEKTKECSLTFTRTSQHF